MSYILEALRKAEAERRTGTAPGIHTPPTFMHEGPDDSRKRRHWLAAGSAIVLTVTGVAVWYGSRPQPAPALPQQVIAVAPSQPSPAPPPPQANEVRRDRTPDLRKEAAAGKSQEKAPRKTPESKPVPRKPAAAENSTRKDTGSQAAEVLTLQQLPDAIRREIPGFKVAGYIYSDNKAERSVLINRRLFREGEEVSPGLKLEKMTPDGLVLSFKGYRYRAPY